MHPLSISPIDRDLARRDAEEAAAEARDAEIERLEETIETISDLFRALPEARHDELYELIHDGAIRLFELEQLRNIDEY